MDEKAREIYEEFRCELGIHERDIIDAQNLHRDLLNKNPFRYDIPQKVTLDDIENISHIKKDDIMKCYKLVLDSELSGFLQPRDDER
jgi:hypothetical protein